MTIYKVYRINLTTNNEGGQMFDIPEGYEVHQVILATPEYMVILLSKYVRENTRNRAQTFAVPDVDHMYRVTTPTATTVTTTNTIEDHIDTHVQALHHAVGVTNG